MFSWSLFAPENLISRDGSDRPVSLQPAYSPQSAESGAYSRDSSHCPRRRPFIHIVKHYRVSPEFIRSHSCVLVMSFTAERPLAQGQYNSP